MCVCILGRMPRKIYISGSKASYFPSLLQRMTHTEVRLIHKINKENVTTKMII